MIGGLIEMNAHMVVTQSANAMIVGGMISRWSFWNAEGKG